MLWAYHAVKRGMPVFRFYTLFIVSSALNRRFNFVDVKRLFSAG